MAARYRVFAACSSSTSTRHRDAEHLQAVSGQTLDGDVVPSRRGPRLPAQSQVDYPFGLASPEELLLAVEDIAERPRGAQRRLVVEEGAAQRLSGAESIEGQVQDGGPHLPPDPVSLVLPAEPGTRPHRPQGTEVRGHELLDAHGLVVDEDRTGEVPVAGAPVGPRPPPVLQ